MLFSGFGEYFFKQKKNKKIENAIENAVEMFTSHGPSDKVPKIIVLFSDGKPNPEQTQSPCGLTSRIQAAGLLYFSLSLFVF